MFKIKCRCGSSEKSFKIDIGEFFMNECCFKAGYDAQGNKEGEEQESEDQGQDESSESQEQEESQEEEVISEEAQEDIAQGVELSNEEADEQKEQPDLDKMNAKALQELCKQRKVQYSKKDTRAKLIEKLQK
tara:strand:+ start:106778 stop:107173 length:396 start_codon:yes stop_codon:yes gene_type:complete